MILLVNPKKKSQAILVSQSDDEYIILQTLFNNNAIRSQLGMYSHITVSDWGKANDELVKQMVSKYPTTKSIIRLNKWS